MNQAINNRILTLSIAIVSFVSVGCSQQPTTTDISVKEFQQQISRNKEAIIFDVRTQGEVDAGVIDAGVLNYDFRQASFSDNVATLDKDKTYYVYCQAGVRSSQAVNIMKGMGFKNVFNVEGGIGQWRKEGLPVVEKAE
ncbi:MAG: rhodanese-like domain-containing protein [Bacteroidetes bacterium]|nr:rhodanese-like domain-containing protein [Bacteroidota bacterium]MDA1121391.1 rhodanese-like domain-containing protein [Bacteroidota bacterium]